MKIDFSNITPLDLRILNHLRKNSITDEWVPIYDYLFNNFNTDPEDTQKIILIYTWKWIYMAISICLLITMKIHIQLKIIRIVFVYCSCYTFNGYYLKILFICKR